MRFTAPLPCFGMAICGKDDYRDEDDYGDMTTMVDYNDTGDCYYNCDYYYGKDGDYDGCGCAGEQLSCCS